MTDAPEKIWVHYEVETDDATWSEYPDTDGVADFKHYGEYTRTDIAKLAVEILSAHKRTSQAKIAELENALAAASGTIAAMRADVTTGQALIAELADALQSVLRVPNSEAAQGIMKVFARDALKTKP